MYELKVKVMHGASVILNQWKQPINNDEIQYEKIV